jgi:hypothetical protein
MVLLLVGFLCFAYPNAAKAAVVEYTNPAAFTGLVGYSNNFSALTADQTYSSTLGFPYLCTTNCVFSVVDAGSNGVYAVSDSPGIAVSTAQGGFDLIFDAFSSNVTAVGGDFFSSDGSDLNGVPLNFIVTLSDTTQYSSLLDPANPFYISPSGATTTSSFFGFINSGGLFITSLEIVPGNSSFANASLFELGNIQTESGVPEPATFGLLAAGLIAGGLLRKRLFLR